MTDSKGEAEKGSGMMLWKKPIPISTCTSWLLDPRNEGEGKNYLHWVETALEKVFIF
jgi:hypothetical protein